MILVSFKGEKTVDTYGPTQVALEAAYGVFPAPGRTDEHILASTKRFSRVVVRHLLYEKMGIPLEQVLLFRSNAD